MDCSLRKRHGCHGLLLSALLLAPGGVALAADNGFYLGLASSDVSSDYDQFAPVVIGDADDDRGFKGIVGFRPLDAFAIEANYVDFGDTTLPLGIACITTPCPNQASVDSQAISVSAVGMLAFRRRLRGPRLVRLHVHVLVSAVQGRVNT